MDGVILTPLQMIPHPKGNILHGVKKSDVGFSGFGEAYFSTVYANQIKGWKKHSQMVLNFVVPIGEVKVVVFNEQRNEYFVEVIGESNYQRMTIAPGLWVAFQGIGNHNLLLNVASIEHNPHESNSRDLEDIAYVW